MNMMPVFVGVTSGAVIAVGLSIQLNKIKESNYISVILTKLPMNYNQLTKIRI